MHVKAKPEVGADVPDRVYREMWSRQTCDFRTKTYSRSYRDFHVSKLASVPEAAPLLPEGADDLAANGCLAVSEGATVSLQKQSSTMTLSVHNTASTHPRGLTLVQVE